MLMQILGGVVVIIGAFLIYVASKPSDTVVSREVTINASADKIFPYVNTRTLANSWNPWLKMDKIAKVSFIGPEVGVGAVTKWDDGKELGTGSATVIESIPNESVTVKLEYKKPFEATQHAKYILKPNGNQTTVIWQVEGKSTFMQKIFCVFINMDKMVGDVFTEGLGQLKTMVEASK
jgi:hypothetical protein